MCRRLSFKFCTIIAAIIIASCLLVALTQPSRRSSYKGKTLRSWLELIQSQNLLEVEEAEAAVRKIGANAVPTLTAYLSHRESALEKRLPKWLTGSLSRMGLCRRGVFWDNYYHSKALCGFRALGTNGVSAVPDLRRFLADSTDRRLANDAAIALVFVAPLQAARLAEEWIANTNRAVSSRAMDMKWELMHAEAIAKKRKEAIAKMRAEAIARGQKY